MKSKFNIVSLLSGSLPLYQEKYNHMRGMKFVLIEVGRYSKVNVKMVYVITTHIYSTFVDVETTIQKNATSLLMYAL